MPRTTGRAAGAYGPDVAATDPRGWRRQWLGALALWALLVLVFSARTEIRGEPFVWVSLTWSESLRLAISQWTSWLLLSVLIVWIDRRLPVRRDVLLPRLICHIPLSVVFTVAFSYLHYGGRWLLDVPGDPSLVAGGLLATSWRVMYRSTTFFYWVIVGVYIALDYQSHLKDRVIRTAELERLLSTARLNNLRNQLQPHFLFNALNAISAYVEQKPRLARQMIEQLGDLLRLSLEHSDEQEITLAQELAFVDRYLKLQAVRFESRLQVSLTSDPQVLDALIPPFILQPLVENAVRYAAAARSSPTRVAVDAWRQNGHVRLRVRDDGPGLPPDWSLDSNAGIGLASIRERLHHLYGPDRHSFAVTAETGGGVRVELSLPLTRADAVP
jgi:two-component system, LytTR family, sensor kinase